MNRDEAVWYYRLGDQTLGPVPWTEIEEVTRDTVDASDLLVARAGDENWVSAADALEATPELGAEEAEEDAAAEEWSMIDEAEPAPQDAVGQPSGAAEEVLGQAAFTSDTGGPRPAPAAGTTAPGAMPREHGLGRWIRQAWEMVTGDLVSFALGLLLAAVVTVVSLGICGPPLQAGLYVMALKRFRGEDISPGTVFEGFQYFLPAWGVALFTALVSFVLMAPLSIPLIMTQPGENQELWLGIIWNVWGQIVGLAIAGAVFYAMVLVVERKLGSIDALKRSWAVTKTQLLSYVGMALVLQLIAAAGIVVCYIGVLVTAPMVPCTQVAAYMYHFRRS